MSLNVYLTRKKYISYDKESFTEEDDNVFSANITHNLGTMAVQAGLYDVLWRPENIGAKQGVDIIRVVEDGLAELKSNPEYYRKFDASNMWGTYDDFVPWVEKYLEALKEYPEAFIEVSR